ncbi:HMG-box, partial [Schizopora paradoxa]
PRPRNSFIIFRTDFVAKHKKEAEAAGDGDGDVRSLSKQASEVWNKMSEAEKVPWQERAEEEKRDHARKYPNYRYRP